MKTACIVLLMILFSLVGCKDRIEERVGPATEPQPEMQKTVEQAAPGPAAPAAVIDTPAPAPQPTQPAVNDKKISANLKEKQERIRTERILDRLEKILDDYYDSDDDEDFDRDTLLGRLKQDLPVEWRDNIPEEVLEEIEWWTE